MRDLKLFSFILAAWTIAACSKDPKTFESARIDTFVIDNKDEYQQANKILQADYMFVVDVSASMGFNSGNLSDPNASKKDEFMGGLVNFVDSLKNQSVNNGDGINYRIGFINGNVHAGRKNDLLGRGFYKNILIDSVMPSSQQDFLIDQLQDIGATLNENTNLMLEAADQAMDEKKSAFVRPGSQLIYLFVSDTDDESPNYISGGTSTTDYAKKLIRHKGTASNIPPFVSARAIVAGVNSNCDPAEDFGETVGRRLAETAQKIENAQSFDSSGNIVNKSNPVSASAVSHCILRASSEFPTLLDQLARDVSKPTNIFQLQVANVDVNSIKVYLDGNLLSNSEWTYMSGSNAVKLNTTPAASSRVVLRYNQFFALKSVPPDVSQIQVQVGSSFAPSSATEGWTYNAAKNRIEFHGTPIANGTVVKVSY